MTIASDLMHAGWALGFDGGMYARWWLQQNGLGNGGPTREVHASTATALCQKRLIEPVPGQTMWTRPKRYQLTATARSIIARLTLAQ